MIKEIINKKENNVKLNSEEIEYFVNNYTNNSITDEDMTLLLKAIIKNDMDDEEIYYLTKYMIESGNVLDLSELSPIVDKHSTGGIGDKTTLIISPIVASCGVNVAKMSGRSLGFTGGTIDKLESIPGFRVNLSKEEFIKQVKDIGVSIISQTTNLVPADKKIYALRDVTNTVESIPLIASSIMSKKIASGTKDIVIDLKVGNGALIKNIEDARKLAKIMISLGKRYDIKVICLLTNMNIPLGNNIGNMLEINEVIDILNNKKDNNLKKLCLELATYMVMMGLNITYEKAFNLVKDNLENGKAYTKFLELIKYQSGDLSKMINNDKVIEIRSAKSGYLTKLDALKLGKLSMELGSGRKHKDDVIDYCSGIVINKNINDYVNEGEVLFYLYTKKDKIDIDNNIYEISNKKIENIELIYEIVC